MAEYISDGIKEKMRKAEKLISAEKSRLGIHFLFRCEVIGWNMDEQSYEVRFSQGNHVLAERLIQTRYLDNPEDLTYLTRLLREIEVVIRDGEIKPKGGGRQ